MKRVLCLISGMNSGGAETFLMKLYRKIDRNFYQMDFCVNIKEEGFYDKEILEMGGRIYHIPSKSENLREFKKQLAELIKNEKYEFVLRVTSNTMGFMDLKIAKKAGAKVCAARSSNSSDAEGVKAKIVHFIGRKLYSRYVDVKIAPSDLSAIYTFGKKEYEKKKVCILKNAVDLDIYKYSETERKMIRKELGISDGELVCGHIGRFSKQKNHKYLIEVFSKVLEKRSDAKLILIGKGELEEEIIEQCEKFRIRNKVLFLGVRSDIPALLSAMDVFIFPSLYEGMPNTVIEAQATGLPCIIANTITKEANVLGTVKFLPLSNSTDLWVNEIMNISKIRYESKETFINKGYEINSSVEDFLNYMKMK